MTAHVDRYLREVRRIAEAIPRDDLDAMVNALVEVRGREGRLFFVGVGGSAANCSHAVNDFRKLAGIESYAPTDNVSELTARTNDEGWDTVFSEWLDGSRARKPDALFVFSVGGGDLERNISANIVAAIDCAKRRDMKVFGVVGKPDGYTARVGDHVIVVPCEDSSLLTPLSEAYQAVIWHCLVSHPDLALRAGKWESVTSQEDAS